jgi:citrate synthase
LLCHASSVNRSTFGINIDSINVDDINQLAHDGAVSTLIRSTEAAALLNVSKPTLYAYVSRGRLTRTTGADGRTSLFARDEVERLAQQSRRAPTGPRPTIDVQISSAITTIDESSLRYRGHDVVDLAASHRFEDVAEMLWSDGTEPIRSATTWPARSPAERAGLAPAAVLEMSPIARIATASHLLGTLHPDDSPADAARRLLLALPDLLGSTRRTGRYAHRLGAAWQRRPTPELVDAIDTALVLLADHELATSTLAVRIAASVRTSPSVAFAAGLASMEGALHGSASAEAHRFLAMCANADPASVIAQLRSDRRPVPGFGHKVYRGVDPRFPPLLDCVRRLDPDAVGLVEAVVTEAGRVMSHQPNVDLALGALTWAAGLEPNTPIFAIARIAGWGAHYAEEIGEPPVRFRGVATTTR